MTALRREIAFWADRADYHPSPARLAFDVIRAVVLLAALWAVVSMAVVAYS